MTHIHDSSEGHGAAPVQMTQISPSYRFDKKVNYTFLDLGLII